MVEPTMAAPAVAQKPNWLAGIFAAIVAGLLGGIPYAAVLAYNDREIGYLAILIGFLVGFAFVKFGKVANVAAGIIAVVIALVVWFFSIEVGTAWYGSTQGFSFFEVLKEELKIPGDLIKAYFEGNAKGYLFAALAAVPAFWLASGLRKKK
jgi:hypothetical protein